MKALVGNFNQSQKMALVGAFSLIVKTDGSFAALISRWWCGDNAAAAGVSTQYRLVAAAAMAGGNHDGCFTRYSELGGWLRSEESRTGDC